MQDSYALCRVFKKNVICSEVEEQQAQCSVSLMTESPRGAVNDYELMTTTSPDVQIGSSSCIDEEDKDDSWMQFITDDDDAWYPSNSSMGGEEATRVTF